MAQAQPQPQQPPPQEPPRQNPFPTATSLASTIFTPISGEDLLAPFNPPTTRIDHLNLKIVALNENHKRVRANIIDLIHRECNRILWDANEEMRILKAQGMGDKIDESGAEVVSEEELDYMIERMMSEGGGTGDGMGRPLEIPTFESSFKEGISFRERHTLLIEMTISKGLMDLNGYEKHVEGIRKGYKEALVREMDRDSQMDLD